MSWILCGYDYLQDWCIVTSMFKFQFVPLVKMWSVFQDFCDSEMHWDRYETRNLKTGANLVKTGRFRETPRLGFFDELQADSRFTVQMERRPFVFVAVPGEADWAKAEFKKVNLLFVVKLFHLGLFSCGQIHFSLLVTFFYKCPICCI